MNARNVRDVDKMAGKFLRDLIDAGHRNMKATCTAANVSAEITIAPSEQDQQARQETLEKGRVSG
jgi:hypothetical protein